MGLVEPGGSPSCLRVSTSFLGVDTTTFLASYNVGSVVHNVGPPESHHRRDVVTGIEKLF